MSERARGEQPTRSARQPAALAACYRALAPSPPMPTGTQTPAGSLPARACCSCRPAPFQCGPPLGCRGQSRRRVESRHPALEGEGVGGVCVCVWGGGGGGQRGRRRRHAGSRAVQRRRVNLSAASPSTPSAPRPPTSAPPGCRPPATGLRGGCCCQWEKSRGGSGRQSAQSHSRGQSCGVAGVQKGV